MVNVIFNDLSDMKRVCYKKRSMHNDFNDYVNLAEHLFVERTRDCAIADSFPNDCPR